MPASPVIQFFLILNAAAVIVYGLDKIAARLGLPRVPEMCLLSMALTGGWPGAALSMALFRHKTSKGKFLFPFVVAVCVNIALIALYWFNFHG